MVEPGAGKAAERAEIDMRLIERVVSGDQARQHAGIGRIDIAANEGEANPRHRPHAETPQDRDMAVPATDQHEVLDNGLGRGGLHV